MPTDGSDYGGQMFKDTDDKGEFSFKGVSPGSYVFDVQQHDQDVRYAARRKIDVGKEKADLIVAALVRGATIHGRVLSSGTDTVDRVRVGLSTTSDSDTAIPTGTGVKKDGSFEMNGVSDGS